MKKLKIIFLKLDGKLDLLENGNPNIISTGINNKGINKTNMFINKTAKIAPIFLFMHILFNVDIIFKVHSFPQFLFYHADPIRNIRVCFKI